MAVEEVFGIVDHFPTFLFEEGNGFADHGEVFLGGGAKDFFDAEEPAFAEDGDDGGFGFEEEADLGIGGGRGTGPAGGTEGGQLAGAPPQFFSLGEKFAVLVVRAGPTALHIMDAVSGQFFGEAELVGKGEMDALPLGAVAQGGVVDRERVIPWPSRCSPSPPGR